MLGKKIAILQTFLWMSFKFLWNSSSHLPWTAFVSTRPWVTIFASRRCCVYVRWCCTSTSLLNQSLSPLSLFFCIQPFFLIAQGLLHLFLSACTLGCLCRNGPVIILNGACIAVTTMVEEVISWTCVVFAGSKVSSLGACFISRGVHVDFVFATVIWRVAERWFIIKCVELLGGREAFCDSGGWSICDMLHGVHTKISMRKWYIIQLKKQYFIKNSLVNLCVWYHYVLERLRTVVSRDVWLDKCTLKMDW